MTRNDLNRAFAIAKTGNGDSSDLQIFNGFGLPNFQPVVCTIKAVAALIQWQCARFDGTWDMENLNEIRHYGRKRFEILD